MRKNGPEDEFERDNFAQTAPIQQWHALEKFAELSFRENNPTESQICQFRGCCLDQWHPVMYTVTFCEFAHLDRFQDSRPLTILITPFTI